MNRVGTLTKQSDGSLRGSFRTLAASFKLDVAPIPDDERRGDQAPNFTVSAITGNGELIEVGAAWVKVAERGDNQGRKFLTLTIDDPSLSAPLNLTAFPSEREGEYELVWRRERQARAS